MRLSRLLTNTQQMRQIFRNHTASIILIYLQRFGRYELSNGPLKFEILVKKSATQPKRWQISKNNRIQKLNQTG
jgi:hypothetical protein